MQHFEEVYSVIDTMDRIRQRSKNKCVSFTRPRVCDAIKAIEKLIDANPIPGHVITKVMEIWATDHGHVFAHDGKDGQGRLIKARILFQ